MAGAVTGDTFIGRKAQELRGLLKLNWPMEGGVVRCCPLTTLRSALANGLFLLSGQGLGRHGAHLELGLL